MVIDKNKDASTAEMRRLAEVRLKAKKTVAGSVPPDNEMRKYVHELQVHQIELEMQNEELCRIKDELEESLRTYAELYDFAPVGYFTIAASGVIHEANHTGAQLLGVDKGQLVNKPFTRFIAEAADRKIFSEHLRLALQRKVMLKCEIKLTRDDGAEIHGRLQSIAVTIGNSHDCHILASVVDVTARKLLEDALQKTHDQLELTVLERTRELTRANASLTQEIEEHRRSEEALKGAYAEIKRLKDRLQAENIYLQQDVARQHNFGDLIGSSSAITQVFTQISQIAPMNATVLLLGETGTGKGVVARAIHSISARKDRPMITVNCTALPANLIESEFFGREKGAFTGSHARQIGRFELADGGTIFLDEIGDMPLELQSKLLRVIQDGEFERLGSPRTIKIDVRIIAASNRNLEEEIRNGRFREDLFYRLNVFPITIPPLRQRKDDIPLLVEHFITKFNKKIGRKIVSVAKETLNILQEYHWPGNVRELESIIERAVIISPGTTLQVLDRFDTSSKTEGAAGQDIKALAELEHDHILQVLRKTGWRIEGKNGAAGILGLNASTLRARMRKFGIVRT